MQKDDSRMVQVILDSDAFLSYMSVTCLLCAVVSFSSPQNSPALTLF